MKRSYILVVVLAAAALVLVGASVFRTGPSPAAAKEGQMLPYRDVKVVELGQEIYAEHCASCHGTNLEGQPDWQGRDEDGYLLAPPHDATGHTWHHADALLVDITTRGSAAVVGDGYQSRMPGFGDSLTEAQILAVLAYIKSTWPEKIIEAHDDLNRRLSSE